MATQTINNRTYHYNITESNPLVSEDYPWGYRLRTTQRYWVETKARYGERLVYQTLNPKTNKWCKEKKCTYNMITILLRDEKDHVKCTGLSRHDSKESMQAFKDKHKDFLSPDQLKDIDFALDINEKISEHYEEVTKKAAAKVAEGKEITLENDIIYTKKEILESTKDLELIAIDISGNAIKKRCRKLDHTYKRLGFIKRQDLSDTIILKARKQANDFIEENYKEVGKMRIVFKEVTFKAPTKESPLFHGMQEMLMGSLLTISA